MSLYSNALYTILQIILCPIKFLVIKNHCRKRVFFKYHKIWKFKAGSKPIFDEQQTIGRIFDAIIYVYIIYMSINTENTQIKLK